METEQTESRRTKLIEQFSKQKVEDPLIKFWLERKKGGSHSKEEKESKTT
jgi:hypothetical protein